MTSFGYWASLAPKGTFMCSICFNNRHVSEAWQDEHGDAWDTCEACALADALAIKLRDLESEVSELVEEIKEMEIALDHWHAYGYVQLGRTQTLAAENEELRSRIADYEKYRTMGGPPRSIGRKWENTAAPQVASASDPTAPPLKRS